MKSRISGDLIALTSSVLSLAMIAAGVPAGTNIAYQLADSKPG